MEVENMKLVKKYKVDGFTNNFYENVQGRLKPKILPINMNTLKDYI